MKVLLSDQETQRRLALKKYNIIHSVIKLAFANITLQRQPAVPNKVRAFFTKITIGFWLASGILASVGLVAYQNLTDFKQAADWQIQKYQAVEQLQDLHFQLQTAALAQNRYLATTQKIYLSEYDRATLIIKQEILQLRQILGNNPHQKAQMTTLDSLVGKEIGLNDRIILDRNNQLTVEQQLNFVEQSKQNLDQLETVIHEIKSQMYSSLKVRSQQGETLAQNTILTFSGGILLNFSILAAVYQLIAREMQGRKRTETMLKQERDFSSTVIDTVGALVIILDTQGRIVRFNRTCEQKTGYSFSEVVGKNVSDLLLIPEDVDLFQSAFEALVNGPLSTQYETDLVTRSGERRLVAWSNTALIEPVGDTKYILATGIDITERKCSEEQLLATTSRLAALIENLQSGILLEDEFRRIALVNQEFCNMFGIVATPSAMIGTSAKDIALHPLFAAPENFQERSRQILCDRHVVSCEELVRGDGQILERDYIPIFIDKNYRGHLWQYRNISDRKESEKSLQQQLIAVESAMDGIAILNQEYEYVYINDAHRQLFGYGSTELIGKTWRELYQENEIVRFAHNVFPLLWQTGRWRGKAEGKKRDGSTFAAEISLTLIPDMGMICVCRDITEQVKAESVLQQANTQLTSWVSELEQRHREISLLGQMSGILQACLTLEEAYTVIPPLMQSLFPQQSGAIFILNASKNFVEAVATWGSGQLSSQKIFTPNDCWALRRCRTHSFANTQNGLHCQHVHPSTSGSICIPMMAQGEALGVLYLSTNSIHLSETQQQLATTVAEHIALALANLKLRETLQVQSIRDPLTGLFNRRYMEESLQQELHRASRKGKTLSIVMLDVDHFKRFNDNYGHEAGDMVLRELGSFLLSNIRAGDIACRYGGEELTLILPEASLEDAQQRANQIREGVKQLKVKSHYQSLGTISLSVGVACFPQHGSSSQAVIRSADAALYRAKAEGRDRVVTAV